MLNTLQPGDKFKTNGKLVVTFSVTDSGVINREICFKEPEIQSKWSPLVIKKTTVFEVVKVNSASIVIKFNHSDQYLDFEFSNAVEGKNAKIGRLEFLRNKQVDISILKPNYVKAN